MMKTGLNLAAIAAAAAFMAACQPQPAEKAQAPAAPATDAAAAPTSLTVPAGTYKLDPTHAILQWSVPHMGLSHYTAKFKRYDATITLDPNNLEASRIVLTIDPTSVDTDYPADYKATHAKSGFATWDEEIGKSDRFINGAKFPQITFTSTKIERGEGATAKVTGDLDFMGVTKPVTMDVTLIGQTASHPMTKGAAVGFHAEGAIKRSDFGAQASPMDNVTIMFDGEFQQQVAAAAAPAAPDAAPAAPAPKG